MPSMICFLQLNQQICNHLPIILHISHLSCFSFISSSYNSFIRTEDSFLALKRIHFALIISNLAYSDCAWWDLWLLVWVIWCRRGQKLVVLATAEQYYGISIIYSDFVLILVLNFWISNDQDYSTTPPPIPTYYEQYI